MTDKEFKKILKTNGEKDKESEAKIWQEVIFPNCSWVFIPNKRITYEGMEGTGTRFPSALIGLNVDEIKNIRGITLRP